MQLFLDENINKHINDFDEKSQHNQTNLYTWSGSRASISSVYLSMSANLVSLSFLLER